MELQFDIAHISLNTRLNIPNLIYQKQHPASDLAGTLNLVLCLVQRGFSMTDSHCSTSHWLVLNLPFRYLHSSLSKGITQKKQIVS